MQNRSLITSFATMDMKPNEPVFPLTVYFTFYYAGRGGGGGCTATARIITYPEKFLELKVR